MQVVCHCALCQVLYARHVCVDQLWIRELRQFDSRFGHKSFQSSLIVHNRWKCRIFLVRPWSLVFRTSDTPPLLEQQSL